jgi:hypothetical protein
MATKAVLKPRPTGKTLKQSDAVARLARRKIDTPNLRSALPAALRGPAPRQQGAHRFQAGQTVTLLPNRYGSNRNGSFEVTRLLPAEHGINHYRLKSVADGHERVAAEDELS